MYPREHIPAPDHIFDNQYRVSCVDRLLSKTLQYFSLSFPFVLVIRARALIPPRQPKFHFGRVMTLATRDSMAIAAPFGVFALVHCQLNSFFGRSSLEQAAWSGGMAGMMGVAVARPWYGSPSWKRMGIPMALGFMVGAGTMYFLWVSGSPFFHPRWSSLAKKENK